MGICTKYTHCNMVHRPCVAHRSMSCSYTALTNLSKTLHSTTSRHVEITIPWTDLPVQPQDMLCSLTVFEDPRETHFLDHIVKVLVLKHLWLGMSVYDQHEVNTTIPRMNLLRCLWGTTIRLWSECVQSAISKHCDTMHGPPCSATCYVMYLDGRWEMLWMSS